MARQYSDTTRLKAVREVKKAKVSLRQVAAKLNIPESTLRRWMGAEGLAIASVNGITDGYLEEAFSSSPSEQEELCAFTLGYLDDFIESLPAHVRPRAREERDVAMGEAIDRVAYRFGPESIARFLE